ncbi:MAG: SDR family NAD(P)-dependent oxidoreductase, partial [Fulvivirga sp.]
MKDKVVIITGGSSGIGKALAEVFGNHGSKIVVTGRKKEALDEVVTALKAQNIDALGFQGDVSIEEDNKKMVESTLAAYGKIDILINNAGISMRAPFNDVELD